MSFVITGPGTEFDWTLLPRTAEATSDGLAIGGIPLRDLAMEFGTPLFVYDEEDLRARFAEARMLFGPDTAYAAKAFLCGRIAQLADETGLLLDVASLGELETALRAGFPGGRLIVHGNNKSHAYLERAARAQPRWVVIDSMVDLRAITAISRSLDLPLRVLVRVNPGVEVHTHEYNTTGNRGSKFGVPVWTGEAEAVIAMARECPEVEFDGLHCHIGSLILDIDNYVRALGSVFRSLQAFDYPHLSVGGGYGVRYLADQEAPSLKEFADAIYQTARDAGFTGELAAEPGRVLVAQSAVTVYTVGNVREAEGIRIVAVDGGMSDNPRPSLYGDDYEVVDVSRPSAVRDAPVRLVGSHCESGDILIRRGALPTATAAGDLVITPVTGAYGYAMSSNYNKFCRPAIVFVSGGAAELVVRRETMDDLLACDRFVTQAT